ncbi:MAG: hypothetical protein ACI80V_003128 [Rhodothermales bacterium]|jgi:hypothetical protein
MDLHGESQWLPRTKRAQPPKGKQAMKRYHLVFGAVALLLSGFIAACSGELLQPGLSSANPYTPQAEETIQGLVDHSINYANTYHGPRTEPGTILLEAMGAFGPLAVDIDVDEMNLALQNAWDRSAGKSPSVEPFRQASDLSSGQKRFLHRALNEAGGISSSQELGTRLARLERDALSDLGPDAVMPVYVVTAFLYAQYAYFSNESNAPKLRRLQHLLTRAAGSAKKDPPKGVQFLTIQTAENDPSGGRPGTRGPSQPPNLGDYYNQGDWWEETLSDTRAAAELGLIGGAGFGCIAGLSAGPAGCAIGAGMGGPIGGFLGVFFGGITSAIINYREAVGNFESAQRAWCVEQRQLNPVLRSGEYNSTCGNDTERQ